MERHSNWFCGSRHSNEVLSVVFKVKISLSFAGRFMATGSFGRDFARFSVRTTDSLATLAKFPLLAVKSGVVRETYKCGQSLKKQGSSKITTGPSSLAPGTKDKMYSF